jgi:DNA repair photolyase
MGGEVGYREEPCRSALNRVTGMRFGWSLNPYMGCAHRCTFCYVRAFERRADRPSDDRYGTSVRVKVNIVEVLRRELASGTWRRESVAIGAATDPYQPAEGRYRLTRGCIGALGAASNPFDVITRGPMIVRDVDVLAAASARAKVSVTFSIPTLDLEVWRRTEVSTAPPAQRLRAMERLAAAGIRVGVGLAPLLPGLSDDPAGIAAVIRAARDHGASHAWCNVLYLRPGTREHFLAHLAQDWPEEVARYERLYRGRAYLPAAAHEPARRALRDALARTPLPSARPLPLATMPLDPGPALMEPVQLLLRWA